MQIKVLGAHNLESENTRFCSLLIDGVIAVDAGALTSSLSFTEQQEIKAVLLTHQHYDHIRDIPALAINYQEHDNTIDVYSTQPVYDALSNHLLNDIIYPNFVERPTVKPALKFHVLNPGQTVSIAGYKVLPVKVTHAIPAIGYRITSAEGKTVFYTSDTGPGLTECWEMVSPDLLIIELSRKTFSISPIRRILRPTSFIELFPESIFITTCRKTIILYYSSTYIKSQTMRPNIPLITV